MPKTRSQGQGQSGEVNLKPRSVGGSSTSSRRRRSVQDAEQIYEELAAAKLKIVEELAEKKLELTRDDEEHCSTATGLDSVLTWVQENIVQNDKQEQELPMSSPHQSPLLDKRPPPPPPSLTSRVPPKSGTQGPPDPALAMYNPLSRPTPQSDIEKLAAALQASLHNSVQSVRLVQPVQQHEQKYDLPVFTGKTSEWLAFKAAYDDTKHKYSKTDNIARLRVALKGSAREAVSALLIANTEPEEVIESLELKYGNQSVLIAEQLAIIRQLPQISYSNIGDITSQVNNCIATLRALHRDEHLNNPDLCSAILSKFDNVLLSKWFDYADSADNSGDPMIVILKKFLKQECNRSMRFAPVGLAQTQARPSAPPRPGQAGLGQAPRPRPAPPGPLASGPSAARTFVPNPTRRPLEMRYSVNSAMDQGNTKLCSYCNDADHSVVKCEKFKSLLYDDRWQWAKENKKCFRCLLYSHAGKSCKISKYLHRLLRLPKSTNTDVTVANVNDENSVANVNDDNENVPADTVYDKVNLLNKNIELNDCETSNSENRFVYLKVLPVVVTGPKKTVNTFALLDEGATITLIDAALADEIGADGHSDPLHLKGVTFEHSENSKRVKISIQGHSQSQSHSIQARTMNSLVLSTQCIDRADLMTFDHIKDLESLIDWYDSGAPRILIGQDNWPLIITQEIRTGRKSQPAASRTSLGWVIHGCHTRLNHNINYNVHNVNQCSDALGDLLKQSFALDNLGIEEKQRSNPENDRAISMLEVNTKRLDSQTWETGLLWKTDNVNLPDTSYAMASKRFYNLEKKLKSNPTLACSYSSQINRLLDNNYAVLCEGSTDEKTENNKSWYLPHFPVINPNKPGKIRPVFDASARVKGVSLNDCLVAGPNLLKPLLEVLWNFRTKKIGVSADIRDMFLRIKIKKEDQDAQKFLWREPGHSSQPPKTYKFTSMLFGATCSPCTAIFVKDKNAKEFQQQHPEAVKAIINNHYMDDYLDSLDTEREAIDRAAEIMYIHGQGGFEIRSWASNSADVLRSIPEDKRSHDKIDLTHENALKEKTLGMYWEPASDTLSFNMSMHRVPAEVASGQERPTKRQLLAIVMSIFDPIGLVSPLCVKGRILLQDVWRSKVDWDNKIEDQENNKFKKWIRELQEVKDCKIPRCYNTRPEVERIQLHTFCDASLKAYAAACYLRYQFTDGEVKAVLVAAKAKVTPLKPISIPRLELQGALLGAKLAKTVLEGHDLDITEKFYWSDSATTIAWIRSDPRQYKAYVGHRLAAIDDLSAVSEWRWLPSEDNVADMATRDVDASHLSSSSRWYNGPAFLMRPEDSWPKEKTPARPVKEAVTEERVNVVTRQNNLPVPDVTKFSSWQRLVRASAYVLLFINKCKKRGDLILTVDLLNAAENMLIKKAQQDSFSRDIAHLENNRPLTNSILMQVTAYLDSEGILRARGRIDAAADVPDTCKRPVILEHSHPYTRLLLMQYHRNQNHASNETVINEVRQKYYINKLRSTVRLIAHNCQLCKLKRAVPTPPIMGDLPPCRLDHHKRPFTHCGLDYFGPLEVAIGRRREKRYGALFTCMVTRAVHMEIAGSLTTDSVIMAIRRMACRRGWPTDIYSDNGTNFKGAEAELKKAWKELDKDAIYEEMTNRRVRWHFIPPTAAHMGGSWERMVQSIKRALYATLKERAPREEVLATLIIEAENTVNSRPLTHVSTDPTESESLTPNHFLIGSTSGIPLMGKFDNKDLMLRKQWRVAQRLSNMFWKRWVVEYLPTLLPRSSQSDCGVDLGVGDLVVICDDALPRNVWPRGVIDNTFPGKDGRVRVVDVRTQGGIFRRPCSKVIKFDV